MTGFDRPTGDPGLWRDAEPPAPPPEMRASVLAAARETPAPAPEHVWDRLWTSRPARLAWGVSVAALLVANLAVDGRSSRERSGRPGGDVELATLLGPRAANMMPTPRPPSLEAVLFAIQAEAEMPAAAAPHHGDDS